MLKKVLTTTLHMLTGARPVALPPGLSPAALGERVLSMCTLSSYLSYVLFATQQVCVCLAYAGSCSVALTLGTPCTQGASRSLKQ